MTERPERQVSAGPDFLHIGPSGLDFDTATGRLTIHINEKAAPLPRPVRGTITVDCPTHALPLVKLDPEGRHTWQPIAPSAHVEVQLDAPNVRWSGHGYVDSNRGDEALEDGVRTWTWVRAPLMDQKKVDGLAPTAVLYDLERRDGTTLGFAKHYSADGTVTDFELPRIEALPTSLWRMARTTPHEGAAPPRVIQTAEDSPFYTRSIIAADIMGGERVAMHESLNMDRFATWWMKALMPVRMPRQFW